MENCKAEAKEEQSVVIVNIHPCNTVFTAVCPNGKLMVVDSTIFNNNTQYDTYIKERYSSSEE